VLLDDSSFDLKRQMRIARFHLESIPRLNPSCNNYRLIHNSQHRDDTFNAKAPARRRKKIGTLILDILVFK
jgi:hypothetical protein